MNIAVLGCGRWGSCISWYLDRLKNNVTVHGLQGSYTYEILKNTGANEYVTFSKTIALTSNLQEALDGKEVAIIAISSQGLRSYASEIIKYDDGKRIYVLNMKGIEVETGKRLTEVMIECGFDKNRLAVWVGPGHIQEFVAGKPNFMVIDGYNKDVVKYLVQNFKSDLIRFYYGDDIIGSEIGAAAKNVMGIVAGMLDGTGYKSLKGALMARGAREVSRLIKAMGGKEITAYGLCHLGDYETTLFSEFSNNRKFGEDYVLGKKFEKLAEGVTTAKAMKLLGEKYNVDLPITNLVYEVIYNGKDLNKSFIELFDRAITTEFYS